MRGGARLAAFTLAGIFLCGCSEVSDREEDLAWRRSADAAKHCPAWRPDATGRHLEDSDGEPVFVLGDAAWALPWKLGRSGAVDYLRARRDQGFNLIGLIAYSAWHTGPNAYGDAPFETSGGEWDPTRPIVAPGDDPRDPDAYDYWDHLAYIVDRACELGMSVVLNPAFGDFIAGSYDGGDTSRIVFDEASAYAWGRWLAGRLGGRTNLIWNLGGDRNAVTSEGDYRGVIRAMAEGIADAGDPDAVRDGTARWDATLMTYWPRKSQPRSRAWNSSEWFHADPWLDFDSIQDWAWDALPAIAHDRALEPAKPTWLFEGRYEDYTPDWTDYQVRYQAYPSVFAGGFGHVYGHEVLYYFGAGWEAAPGDEALWRAALTAPGAAQMGHLRRLMESLGPSGLASRRPAPELLVGDRGQAGSFVSSRIEALVADAGRTAFVYTADGRTLRLDPAALAGIRFDAWWFDPRRGVWTDAAGEVSDRPFRPRIAGQGGPWSFDPPGEPGEGNDWVLVLRPAGTPAAPKRTGHAPGPGADATSTRRAAGPDAGPRPAR